MRLFIGIPLKTPLQAELEAVQSRLKSLLRDASCVWTRRENFHITVRFLGEVAEEQVKILQRMLDGIAQQTSSSKLSIDSLGYFPPRGRVRVIWAGGKSSELLKISHSLDQTLADLGFAPEEKPFHAHVTLARVGKDSRLTARRLQPVIDSLQFAPLTQKIDSIALFQSIQIPGGTHYEILHRSYM